MSRKRRPNEYVLRVNLAAGPDVRRFCEVVVKGHDVYIYQPRKGGSVKVSYHASGQKHVKIGAPDPVMASMHLDPPLLLVTEETPWSQSIENFNALLPYKGEPADEVLALNYVPLSDSVTVVAIGIGRSFDVPGWSMDGVTQVTLQQALFPIPHASDGFTVCVRVVQLQSSMSPSPRS